MMAPWLDMCCVSIKRPLPQVICRGNITEVLSSDCVQVSIEELMLRLGGSRMLLMLCECVFRPFDHCIIVTL